MPALLLNADRDRDIVARSLAGESQNSIAKVYGISRERVRQVLHREGYMARNRPTIAARVRPLAAQGLTIEAIADHLKLTSKQVYRAARYAGIPWESDEGRRLRTLDDKIIPLLRSGMRPKQVAEQTGLSVWSIANRAKTHEIRFRKVRWDKGTHRTGERT